MLRVPIGIRQDMDTNEISEAFYDTAYGHQYICGATMSGKSTLLQTILLQLMEYYDPDAVRFYLIDYGNYMMELFEHAPHVGDIMNNDDKEKIKRFFLYIEKELKERIRFFRNGSYGTYAQKYGADRPMILIAIDGFESFWDEYLCIEENQNTFKMLLREGMRAGILFLLGKGTTKRIAYGFSMENVRTLAALGYEKEEKYDEAFDGFASFGESLKERIKKENFELPGKGILKAGKKMFLVQSALPIDVAEDYDRYDALAQKCREMNMEWEGKCAPKVPAVPSDFTSEYLFQMAEVQKMQKDGKYLPIGLNLYSVSLASLSLADTFIYPIVGSSSSGKSNLLRLFMKEAMLQNWKGIVIDPKNIHKMITDGTSLTHIATAQELLEVCHGLISEIRNRNEKKRELLSMMQGNPGELILDEFDPYFVFIDSLNEFYELLGQKYSKEKNIGGFLYNIMEKGMNCGVYFIITADSYKRNNEYPEPVAGMTKMIKNNCHQGIFLGGQIAEDRWFELNYSDFKRFQYDLGVTHGKGTALLVTKAGQGQNELVKVPLVQL